MHPYLGDFAGTQTVHLSFNTSDLGADPITLAGTPAFHVYRDDGDTEDASGITSSIDRDGRTGFHSVAVDLSADPVFYEDGHDYWVVITTGTVDGISVVGKVLAQFSMRNRSAHQALPATLPDVGDPPTADQVARALWYLFMTKKQVVGTEVQFLADDQSAEAIKFEVDAIPASVITRIPL